MLLFLVHNSLAAVTDQEREMGQLYDCARKLNRVHPLSNSGHNVEFLADDLFYILETSAPVLYVYTPVFAGKSDLAQAKEKEKLPEWDGKFPYTLQNFNSVRYDMRIPYLPADPGKTPGYYYVNIVDSIQIIHDESYYEAGKMKIRRLNPPKIIGSHNLHSSGLARFLPGKPKGMPDFTDWHPKRMENRVTITSVSGQADQGVRYTPLDVERKIWKKSLHGNFSPEAKKILIVVLSFALHHLPPEHKVGEGSGCEGHMGCDWTWNEEMVAQEHIARQDARDTCSAALP